MQLPSDDDGPCGDSGGVDSSVPSPALPDGDGGELQRAPHTAQPSRGCCKLKCFDTFNKEHHRELQQLRHAMNNVSSGDREDFIWDLVRASTSEPRPDGRKYKLLNSFVCRRAWKTLVGLGSGRMQKLQKALSSGCLRPPEDQRKMPCSSRAVSEKFLDADAFFNFLYHNVAEPLADADNTAPELAMATAHMDHDGSGSGSASPPSQPSLDDGGGRSLVSAAQTSHCDGAGGLASGAQTSHCDGAQGSASTAQPSHCDGAQDGHMGTLLQWLAGKDTAAATSTQVALLGGVGERRWLPHMSRQELYELYLFHGPPEDRAKKSRRTCFFKCFHKQGWDRLLKIRDVAQHARCETCARLSKTIHTAPSDADRKGAEQALRVHRLRNLADWAVDFRLSMLS